MPINVEYSPIYQRVNNNVPTTTNHAESCHKQINTITRGLRNLLLRLAYICKYIVDRCERINKSAEDNFRNYLNNLKEKAKRACERGDDIDKYSKAKCNCGRKFYFSQLYCLDVPCIHEILNENYDEKILIESFRANNIDFQSQNYIELLQEFEKLQEYEIETDLRFAKKKKHIIIITRMMMVNRSH